MKIVKRFTIESTHFLPGHNKCGELHGHGWKIWIELSGDVDKYGMLTDFSELKRGMQPVIDSIDHIVINKIIEFPTAENIILYLLEQGRKKFPNISRIRVQETEDNYAEWP